MDKEVQPERFNEHTDTSGNTRRNNEDQSLTKINQIEDSNFTLSLCYDYQRRNIKTFTRPHYVA